MYPITPVGAADEPAVPAVPCVPVCPIAIYGSGLPPAITIFANAEVPASLLPTLIVFLTNDSSNIAILADTKNSSCPKYCQKELSL